MSLEITVDTDKSEVLANWSFVAKLHDQFFEKGSEKFKKKFEEKPHVTTFLAKLDNELAGFKMAYESEPETLYSWMGGIAPEHRRKGLALKLMEAQHQWAKEKGYKKIMTKSTNHFVPMIILNLKSGFKIMGTEEDKGRTKVVMEKLL